MRGRAISIIITAEELIDADVDHPRELVQAKFLEKGFMVTNFTELKYFGNYDPAKNIMYFKVEGNVNLSLLSR